jgi:hypothetical protein
MRTFHWVSGELTEVQRFINLPMRWCEQYPARERRELWIKAIDGPDIKLVVHTRFLPARRGHDVDALLFGDLPVGLFNHSTGDQINFLRTDPPLLWRRCDAAWIVGITVASVTGFALLSWPWLLVGVPVVVVRTVLVVGVRMLWRWSIRPKVDAALAVAARAAQPRPRLRRVK